MKTKKTIIIFSIISIILFSSCTPAFKTLLSVKDPKVETDYSIQNYLKRINSPIRNNFVFDGKPDSLQIYQNIMKSFYNEPQIFKNNEKYCYQGKSNCPSVKISSIKNFNSFYSTCIDDTLHMTDLLSRLRPISKSEEIENTEDLIYIYVYWSIFHKKRKHKKEYFNLLYNLCLDESVNCEVVLINVDLNSKWGLIPEKKMRMRFKMKKSKSIDLEFGKIPYIIDSTK
jgi:hypothetical protein